MPDDLTAELAKMKHDHRQHVSANFPAPGICVSRCADSQPRWPCHAYRAVAALEAVLKLADEAGPHVAVSGTKRYFAQGRTLDPAEIREAITREITGKGEPGA